MDVVILADEYDMPELKRACEAKLAKHIKLIDCILLVSFAELYRFDAIG